MSNIDQNISSYFNLHFNTPNRYNDFASLLRDRFGGKIQKIGVDVHLTCPNRDGNIGIGGCSFCNLDSFRPSYCGRFDSIGEQLDSGISFFRHKYRNLSHFLAYFQFSTNSYADEDLLFRFYGEALLHPQIVGLVIGTRPDCVSPRFLDRLCSLCGDSFVMIEYGVESTIDKTLDRINRGHSYGQAVEAIRMTAERGICVGAHLILGLPGETWSDFLSHADRLSSLPLDVLKLHHLQILRNTKMEIQYRDRPSDFALFTCERYLDLLVDFIARLNPKISLDRFVSQSPPSLLIAPRWGVKTQDFLKMLQLRLEKKDVVQGMLYKNKG